MRFVLVMALMVSILIPVVTIAQNYQDMSEEAMQQMMQQMQRAQKCMQNIDQQKMNELAERTKRIDAELKSLCNSGRRDEAQAKAITFGKEMANDPTMTALKKCGQMASSMMPDMARWDRDDASDEHVCDSIDR